MSLIFSGAFVNSSCLYKNTHYNMFKQNTKNCVIDCTLYFIKETAKLSLYDIHICICPDCTNITQHR